MVHTSNWAWWIRCVRCNKCIKTMLSTPPDTATHNEVLGFHNWFFLIKWTNCFCKDITKSLWHRQDGREHGMCDGTVYKRNESSGYHRQKKNVAVSSTLYMLMRDLQVCCQGGDPISKMDSDLESSPPQWVHLAHSDHNERIINKNGIAPNLCSFSTIQIHADLFLYRSLWIHVCMWFHTGKTPLVVRRPSQFALPTV